MHIPFAIRGTDKSRETSKYDLSLCLLFKGCLPGSQHTLTKMHEHMRHIFTLQWTCQAHRLDVFYFYIIVNTFTKKLAKMLVKAYKKKKIMLHFYSFEMGSTLLKMVHIRKIVLILMEEILTKEHFLDITSSTSCLKLQLKGARSRDVMTT